MPFNAPKIPFSWPLLSAFCHCRPGAQDFKEPPFFADLIKDKKLPPLAQRIPKDPIVVDTGGPIWRRHHYPGPAAAGHPLHLDLRLYAARRL